MSSSPTGCSAQTANPFRTLTHTETVIVPDSRITTGYFRMVDEVIPVTLHTYTLTGPTTFITTIADPVTVYKNNDDCCGPCSVYFPTVSLAYWPVASPNTTCLDPPKTSTKIAARGYDPPTNLSLSRSYAVGSDGFTYTSPSVYVAFGDVTAGNLCGTVGVVHSSVTLAFAPGELSTYDWRGGSRAFDPNDLPCGPNQPFVFGPMGIQGAPEGGIYKPTVYMPEKLRSLDPAWASCKSDYYEGVDPPHPLTAVVAMDPAMTTTATGPPSTTTPARPNSTPNAPPMNTGDPRISDPSPAKDGGSPIAPASDVHASPTAFPPPLNKPDSNIIPTPAMGRPPASKDANPPSLNNGDSEVESKPALASPIPSNGQPAPSRLANVGSQDGNSGGVSIAEPAIDPQLSNGEGHTHLPASQTGQAPVSTLVATRPLPAQTIVVQGHTIAENSPPVTIEGNAVGFSSGSIYVGGNVAPAPTHAPQQPSATVFQGLTFFPLPPNAATTTALPIATIDGKILTAAGLSGDLVINSITIKPGDAPITVAGTPISVGAGVVAIGSTTITIPTPIHNLIFTIGDHPFTADPTGFSIFDTTLLPGSPGVTISGTQLSLAPSGVLVIGSRTVQLSSLPPPTPPPITLGSQTFTANSLSQYTIDGQTLVPDGPAITVNGTPISLPATPSDVVIGSSTEVLAASASARTGLGGVILSGLGPIGPGESTTTMAANANYTGPTFGSSTGCVAYGWSWPLLGLSLSLGVSPLLGL